ncbi:hypothetical protein MKX01_005988 [Papaver californicum]|nr:hypothetical protein MKX01_005988 [Papaver californicum]
MDSSISSGEGGFRSVSIFGSSFDLKSFINKPKGCPTAFVTVPPKGGMQLGKTQRTNKFLEYLKAEGEVIVVDVKKSGVVSISAAPPTTDPITLKFEEKLNMKLKRERRVSNIDVQGALMHFLN